jgi:hypothetical protein
MTTRGRRPGTNGGWGVVRPGSPSAKTFPRAGSPNHQDDSKEGPMVTPNRLVAGMPRAGKGSPARRGMEVGR